MRPFSATSEVIPQPYARSPWLALRSPALSLLLATALASTLHGCALLPGDAPSSIRACPPTSFTKTLSPTDRTVTLLSYQEPTSQVNGHPMDSFSHTTLYLDINGHAQEYTKRDGTSRTGGGTIGPNRFPPLVITIPETYGERAVVRLCVTGTNQAGEGPPS